MRMQILIGWPFPALPRVAGYKYTFPFMSIDCGLTVDDNYVQPLYKHCININRPTMAIIGLPYYVCASQMFDLQVSAQGWAWVWARVH